MELVVRSPLLVANPSLATAAVDCKATGILSLEAGKSTTDFELAERWLNSRRASAVGLWLDALAPASAVLLSSLGCLQQRTVVLEGPPETVDSLACQARAAGARVVLVVCQPADIAPLQALGPDLLCARGVEAGGRVGDLTTFILLQHLRQQARLPFWAFGGVGLHSAAGYRVLGAAGVVLEAQLWGLGEAGIPAVTLKRLSAVDGSEATWIAGEDGRQLRCVQLDPELRGSLRHDAAGHAPQLAPEAMQGTPGRGSPIAVAPAGLDLALMSAWAGLGSLSGALAELRGSTADHSLALVAAARSLGEQSPLARQHGTRFPIVQGPMARVSDGAAFALAVADAGALPFVAMALLRGDEAGALLRDVAASLGERPWGVGLLGFAPPELSREQLQLVAEHRPPFAILAGGRPSQAHALEEMGVCTYVHVPHPQLVEPFLREGIRHLIFEGRECGGHIGPYTSCVLWDRAVDLLLQHLAPAELQKTSVLLAGGIHDAASAAAALATVDLLVDNGVRVGVLMGSAYLFTSEAVASSAIQPAFQQVALACHATAVLESAPGMAVQCASTASVKAFAAERLRLITEGTEPDAIRERLELFSMGRLRAAAKGVLRSAPQDDDGALPLRRLSAEEQLAEGLFMIGQVATLRTAAVGMRELHEEVSAGGSRILAEAAQLLAPRQEPRTMVPVAIVGVDCLLPGAADVDQFWTNVIRGVDAIRDVPRERWDVDLIYAAGAQTGDAVACRSGGFVEDVLFDPVELGLPPSGVTSLEPAQILAMISARRALRDAGYGPERLQRRSVGVIYGAGALGGEITGLYLTRAHTVVAEGEHARRFAKSFVSLLPPWSAETFPGLLQNVVSGRVSNRLGLTGPNYIVDAACASALAAIQAAISELDSRSCDMVVTGGIDNTQGAYGYLAFGNTGALSPTGCCRAFDRAANGTVLGEGVASLVLKRYDDALRDGDQVYAVIRGVFAASDGRALGVTAPSPEGQRRTLDGCYRRAGVSPNSVQLIEAHGTGTTLGDQTEAGVLDAFLRDHSVPARSVALGSVKSMIGHTKAASGAVSLLKAALALRHGIMPPTLHVDEPLEVLSQPDCPLFLIARPRPWLRHGTRPRRAGVSASGFGGTNFHITVEEPSEAARAPRARGSGQAAALFLFGAESPAAREALVSEALAELDAYPRAPLPVLARSVWGRTERRAITRYRLAVAALDRHDLRAELEEWLRERAHQDGGEGAAGRDGARSAQPEAGAHMSRTQRWEGGADQEPPRLAVLFPGQGTQVLGMPGPLLWSSAGARAAFGRAAEFFAGEGNLDLVQLLFPSIGTDEAEAERALADTALAQPALAAAQVAALSFLDSLEIEPSAYAGHSFGELTAVHAAGVLTWSDYVRLVAMRGRTMAAETAHTPGAMVAVSADVASVRRALDGLSDVHIANDNSPMQVALSCARERVGEVREKLAAAKLHAVELKVSCAFHSPAVASAARRFAEALRSARWQAPRVDWYANTTGERFSGTGSAALELMTRQMTEPVRFRQMVESMWREGIRVFLDAGPRAAMARLVRETLPAAATIIGLDDASGQVDGIGAAVGSLWAAGIGMNATALFAGAGELTGEHSLGTPTSFLVNPHRVAPLRDGRPQPAFQASRTLDKALNMLEPAAPNAAIAVNAHGQRSSPSGVSRHARDGDPLPESPLVTEQIGIEFQKTMQHFLRTEERVMLALLGRSDSAITTGEDSLPLSEGWPAYGIAAHALEAPAAGRRGAEIGLVQSSGAGSPPVVPPGSNGAHLTVEAAGAESEAAAAVKSEALSARAMFLSTTCELTGYPAELLRPDVRLEADLGIDSLKRLSIVSRTLDKLAQSKASLPDNAIDAFLGLKTVQEYGDRFDSLLAADGLDASVAPAVEPSPPPAPHTATNEATVVRECPVRAAVPHGPQRPLARTWVVIAPPTALAQATVEMLQDAGAAVSMLPLARNMRLQESGDLAAAVQTALGATPSPAGRGVLLLIDDEDNPLSASLSDLPASLTARLIAPFAVLQRGAQLRAEQDTSVQFTVAARANSAWSDALSAIARTLRQEVPGLDLAFVRLGACAGTMELQRALLAELTVAEPADVEIDGEGRWAWGLEPRPLHLGQASHGRDAPVTLLLGGARGITARVAQALGSRGHRLVLLGRTDPTAGEPARHAREVRQTLAGLQREGIAHAYVRGRVEDVACISEAFSAARRLFGEEVTQVVHAAGIIEDGRFQDKTADSFLRVLSPKVVGLHALLAALGGRQLDRLTLFSSIAGVLGNRGQVDYAAANGLLNGLARHSLSACARRVQAIAWGPWDGVGMVDEVLQSVYRQRRIALLSPQAAVQALLRELEAGESERVVVLRASAPQGTGRD